MGGCCRFAQRALGAFLVLGADRKPICQKRGLGRLHLLSKYRPITVPILDIRLSLPTGARPDDSKSCHGPARLRKGHVPAAGMAGRTPSSALSVDTCVAMGRFIIRTYVCMYVQWCKASSLRSSSEPDEVRNAQFT